MSEHTQKKSICLACAIFRNLGGDKSLRSFFSDYIEVEDYLQIDDTLEKNLLQLTTRHSVPHVIIPYFKLGILNPVVVMYHKSCSMYMI